MLKSKVINYKLERALNAYDKQDISVMLLLLKFNVINCKLERVWNADDRQVMF